MEKILSRNKMENNRIESRHGSIWNRSVVTMKHLMMIIMVGLAFLILSTLLNSVEVSMEASKTSTAEKSRKNSIYPSSRQLANEKGKNDQNKNQNQNKENAEEASVEYPSTEVAWLVSYPSSGKEYLRNALQTTSQRSMATNYGIQRNALSSQGPYRLANKWPLPEKYVLTETHCHGFCFSCHRGMFENAWREFYKGCGRGNAFVQGGTNTPVEYDYKSVSRVVHLIRDPFENVAARFHFEYENNKDKKRWNYEMTLNGLYKWCQDFDARSAKHEEIFADPTIAELASKVPCHGLLYQYVQWHNNVNEMVWNTGEKIHGLEVYFEDLSVNLDKTMDNLLTFLSLPRESNVTPKLTIQDFINYYTERDRVAISSYLKVLATQDTWSQIKRYLPPPTLETTFSPVGSALSPNRYGTWPEIAWLLTYPNSGTGFTTALVQRLSRFAAATNYAHEVGDNRDDIPHFAYGENGPFRYNKRPFPKSYILTKNHCVGHCISCGMEMRVVQFDDFLKGCGKVWKFDDKGRRKKGQYDPALAKKVVHLIRSPFDNLVANFHYDYKYHHDIRDDKFQFPYNREGFRAWCQNIDSGDAFIANTYYTEQMKTVIFNVPCHTVFYQYALWHNHAFEVSKALNIPQHVIHYEDFHFKPKESIRLLFQFLELPRPGTIEPFQLHSYPDYFTEAEVVQVTLFIKMCASFETLAQLNRYF